MLWLLFYLLSIETPLRFEALQNFIKSLYKDGEFSISQPLAVSWCLGMREIYKGFRSQHLRTSYLNVNVFKLPFLVLLSLYVARCLYFCLVLSRPRLIPYHDLIRPQNGISGYRVYIGQLMDAINLSVERVLKSRRNRYLP